MSCDEVLEKIQECLHFCKSNRKIYQPNQTIDITQCENLRKYKTSLKATDTKMRIDTKVLLPNVQYAIEYDVRKRLLTMYTESDRK
jgi:hypothetical protein